jgi:hypothetical protein
MPTHTISLNFLARQQEQILEELRGVRAENRDIRRTFTLLSEHFSRQERRLGELRDDPETMIKLELGGSMANLESRLENHLASTLLPVEGRIESVENKLGTIDDKVTAILTAVSR